MHDALQAILGLDVLTDAERALAEERRAAEAESKAAKQELSVLLARLKAHPDDRVRSAEKALTGKTWDLPGLAALAVGDAPPPTSGPACCDRSLRLPCRARRMLPRR